MNLEFIGIGSAKSAEHGFSSALITQDDGQRLLIDYGSTTHTSYWNKYNDAPEGIYITHTHHDHISGLQSLFFKIMCEAREKVRLFVPVDVIKQLHLIQGSYHSLMAEGANFWDAFQLIPVTESFWFGDTQYNVFQNQHHNLGFSYGIALKNRFLYTGDTKPIPATISSLANKGYIFHDLCLVSQPSHTSIQDLVVYEQWDLDRFYFYHLHSKEDVTLIKSKGYKAAEMNKTYEL